jgi:hypothetical protein
MENDESFDAHSIIQKLGSFAHIFSPAKQAARIGQAFSDTLTSIQISKDIITRADDIVRNGRVFSDGVGTISYRTIYKIWREYALRAKVKPTVFQIRLGGNVASDIVVFSLECILHEVALQRDFQLIYTSRS